MKRLNTSRVTVSFVHELHARRKKYEAQSYFFCSKQFISKEADVSGVIIRVVCAMTHLARKLTNQMQAQWRKGDTRFFL